MRQISLATLITIVVLLLGVMIAPAMADGHIYSGFSLSFEIPEGYEVNEGTDLVRVEGEGQTIVVVAPEGYATVIGGESFDNDDDALNFYVERTGYTVTEDAGGVNVLAATGVALERRGQSGVAYLLDLGFDRRGVVIGLADEGEELDTDAVALVRDTLERPGDLLDLMTTDERFTTLVAAAQAADPAILDTLSSGGVTVFAPTNQAFINVIAYLGTSEAALLANTEALTNILLYHVVDGEVLAEDVVALDGSAVDTLLENNRISIDLLDSGTVQLNNVVEVIETDIVAANGVIHVINDVLLPDAALPEATPEATEEAGN